MLALPGSEDELADNHLEVLLQRLRQERRDVPVHVQRLRVASRAVQAGHRARVELVVVRALRVVPRPLRRRRQRRRHQPSVVEGPAEQQRVPLPDGLELQPGEELAFA